jgi:hypothetical protein
MDHRFLHLDFDGVLHSVWEQNCLFERVPLLENWLQARPDIRLVITSSWRLHHSPAELALRLRPTLAARVVGMSPHIRDLDLDAYPDRLHAYERELEICAWLRAHAQPWAHWAALDDMPGLFSPSCNRLVVCDSKVGLTSLQLELLDQVFARNL